MVNGSRSTSAINLLIVEDSEFDLEAVLRALAKEGFDPQYTHVYSKSDYLAALEQQDFDLIICDHRLPDFDSFTAFEILQQTQKDTPFIIVSGAITEERAAQTLKRGAADFLSKSSLTRLGSSIREALENKVLKERTRQADRELKQTQDRLKLAVESTNLGTWEYNAKADTMVTCDRCRLIQGLPADGPISIDRFAEAIAPAHREPVRQALADELAHKGDDHAFELAYQAGPRWVSLRGKTYVDPTSDSTRLAGIMLDITAAKAFEAELKTAKTISEKANKAKSEFLANMSHEIRTPLGAMVGFAELLDEAGVSDAERRDFIATIKRNGQELTRLIDEILDLSKVEAGHLELERREFSPLAVLEEVVESLKSRSLAKNVRVLIERPEPVPEVIVSDAARLRQIILNVISNAIKFSEGGTVRLAFRVERRKDQNPLLNLTVQDTGIGIDPSRQDRLFQPFQQADSTTTRKFGGTGLGLALSRRLANALGGDVVLKSSALDQGSCFVVSIDTGIPEQSLADGPYVKGGRPPKASKTIATLSGCRILVAEDSPDNQFLIRRILERAGATVTVVEDGFRAVETALASQPELVVMDIQMPQLDGHAATRELRRQNFTAPIIALTAHAMREEQARCLESGFDAHLAKPINPQALVEAISKLAPGSRTVSPGGESVH